MFHFPMAEKEYSPWHYRCTEQQLEHSELPWPHQVLTVHWRKCGAALSRSVKHFCPARKRRRASFSSQPPHHQRQSNQQPTALSVWHTFLSLSLPVSGVSCLLSYRIIIYEHAFVTWTVAFSACKKLVPLIATVSPFPAIHRLLVFLHGQYMERGVTTGAVFWVPLQCFGHFAGNCTKETWL